MSDRRPSSAVNPGDDSEEDSHPFRDCKVPNGNIPLSRAIAQLNTYKWFADGVGDWVNDSDTLDENYKTAEEEFADGDIHEGSAEDVMEGSLEGGDQARGHSTYSSSSRFSFSSDLDRRFMTGRRFKPHALNDLLGQTPVTTDDEEYSTEESDEDRVLHKNRQEELDAEDRNDVEYGGSADYDPPKSLSGSHSEVGEESKFSSLVIRGKSKHRLNQERVNSSQGSESGVEADDEEEFTDDEVEVTCKGGLEASAPSGTTIGSDDEVVDKKTARAVLREFLETEFDAGFNRAWDRVKKRKADSIN